MTTKFSLSSGAMDSIPGYSQKPSIRGLNYLFLRAAAEILCTPARITDLTITTRQRTDILVLIVHVMLWIIPEE